MKTNTRHLNSPKSSRKTNHIIAAAVAAALASFSGHAKAQQFFDSNGAVAGLGINGSNIWDTTTANWGAAGGTTAGVVWANTATSDAVFAGTAGFINNTVNVTVRNITFDVSGYSIDGNLSTITFAPSATVTVAAGQTAQITESTGGASGLTIAGPGTLTFGGIGINAYTGTTSVTGGTLNLNKSISNRPLPET